MKQLNVTVKDKNTIILAEDGKAGDYINLAELANVDCSQIEDLIEKGQDKVYEKKLAEFKQLVLTQKEAELNQQKDEYRLSMVEKEKEHQAEIAKLNETISNYNATKAVEQKELTAKYELKVTELNSKYKALEASVDKEVENASLTLKQQHQVEITKLNETITNLNSAKAIDEQKLISDYELTIQKLTAKYQELESSLAKEIENSKLKVEQSYANEIAELKSKLQLLEAESLMKLNQKEAEMNDKLNKVELDCATKLNEKDMVINQLQNQKSALNVKMIGENLEATCNDEMESYMQNGFFNCTWQKDNEVVKNDDEKKGSKADYIFKVYATDEHKPEELLASVCLDMKDENPDSKNKLKNSSHYADLDKNRNKKGCKYAVLVSTLEMKTNNDLPIRKVNEYPDMYVVRPAYMVSFLSMITSLSMKFKDLLLQDVKEKLEVKSRQELLDKFEEIKNTYLDKQLASLEKDINTIRTKSEAITNAAKAIDDTCDKIARSYIDVIHKKLETFEASLNKAYRKYEKSC